MERQCFLHGPAHSWAGLSRWWSIQKHFQFEKIGSSNIISDKYRKKIKILQYYDDEIRIQGDLDLDTDQETSSVLVILKNNNATFKGSGIFQEYSDKTENIKIVLAPLN